MTKHKVYPLHQSPLYKLSSKKRLAGILHISVRSMTRLSKSSGKYDVWDEMNERGKTRTIEHPKPPLKKVQARIANLLSSIEPPDFLFCPVKGRSYILNANHHRDGKVVKTIDIKKYFPSTKSRRIFWFYNSELKCSRDVAGILTALSTLDGHLPTGSPHSPILSYYAHSDMWERINVIARENGCVVSVYIDDLCVSGPYVPAQTIWKFKKEIYRTGLRYHKEKSFRGGLSRVTGVIIKDGELRLPNNKHLKMRNIAAEIRSEPDDDARMSLIRRLKGVQQNLNQIRKTNALA